MPTLDRGGRFSAVPMEWGVDAKGDGAPYFRMKFKVMRAKEGEEWALVPEDTTITGYFYLFKKDQTPNTSTVEKLASALGWDGSTLESLHNSDWSKVPVQIETTLDLYNVKQRTKVNWIHPHDYTGAAGFEKKTAEDVAGIQSKWGDKLKAAGVKPGKVAEVPEDLSIPEESIPF